MDNDSENKNLLPDDEAPDQEPQPKGPGKYSKLIQGITAVFIAVGTFFLLFLSGYDLEKGARVDRPEIYWRYGWLAFIGVSLIIVYLLERKKKYRFKTWWLTFLIAAVVCLVAMVALYLLDWV
ncbi:MAG: hypothetical protein Q8O09_01400 [Bacillota bacterium]|nr:hypothetical protein [Bacillota bacterium]